MDTLASVLKDIAKRRPGTVLFGRTTHSWLIEDLLKQVQSRRAVNKITIRKKQYYWGLTGEGLVSVVRNIPEIGAVTIFLEGEPPPPYGGGMIFKGENIVLQGRGGRGR